MLANIGVIVSLNNMNLPANIVYLGGIENYDCIGEWGSYGGYGNIDFSKESDKLYLSVVGRSTGASLYYCSHSKQIDVTKYNKMKVDWEGNVDSGGGSVLFGIGTQTGTYNPILGHMESFQRKIDTLDISSFIGLKYLNFQAYHPQNNKRAECNIYKIWFE